MKRPRVRGDGFADVDRGSTIPLILGFFLIALILVAGSVAAGDAFVHQRELQSICDGAAVAAASGADIDSQRHPGEPASDSYLVLGRVQRVVDTYLSRDPSRADVRVTAGIDGNHTTVTTRCLVRSGIAFGSFFGFGAGVEHRAVSAARAPLRAEG
jgi:uncharacterized membrane protein